MYYHFVWTTWRRQALITDEIERPLYRCIESQVRKVNGTVLAIGGISDHVHLAVLLPGIIAPSQLMQRAKGVSSTFGRDELLPGGLFGWQDGYGGFTISGKHVDNVVAYIRNQKHHHAEGTLVPEWEPSEEPVDSPTC